MIKSLKDISWLVTEDTYRQENALSYSLLAKYEREGFNNIKSLFDRIDTPSLTFGSAVDSIITGGEEEFNERFLVSDFPNTPDNIIKIVKSLFNSNSIVYKKLKDIPDDKILDAANEFQYSSHWKPETRIKVIKEKGSEYYNLLFVAQSKTIVDTETYNDVLASVRALKESIVTKDLFADNSIFDNSIERFYQLKFKATFEDIKYKCMADLLYVNHTNKIILPVDLKTSSKPEWDFYKSFIDWRYDIQSRLYWKIIRYNLNKDEYFKDYKLLDYVFVVVNRKTLTPLVWNCPFTQQEGNLEMGKYKQLLLRDPLTIGKELTYYLNNNPKTPIQINENDVNNLEKWINKI